MAMRFFTLEEFEDELDRAGLERTDIITRNSRLWKKDGYFVSAPRHPGHYPDSVLEGVLRQAGRLYYQPKV